jgi:hypothetical protein
MSVDELAEELADFWFSALAEANWEQRLQILNEIHAQLLADMETRAEFQAVSPRFVAALIERLGSPPVENASQAQIYAFSAHERHREAAKAWSYRSDARDAQLAAGFVQRDRRRHPRTFVDAMSEIWVHGRPAPCRLVDISLGGARVVVREPAPEPGTQVRLSVPDTGTRDAMVVFRNRMGVGVQFLEIPAAA